MRFSFQDPTQPLTEDTGIVEVAPEQKERKEKKKTVVEAGDTTGAPSAAAVTIMNNTTDNQPAVRGTGTHTLQEARSQEARSQEARSQGARRPYSITFSLLNPMKA